MKICPTCQRTHADELAFCPHDATPLQASAAPLVGQVFGGQYEIEALIAETSIGQLYRARQILLGDRVALKRFRPELYDEVAKWLSRFYRESQASLGFRHPNAVAVYDLRAEYMVMEYVEGQTLDKVLRQRGRFTPQEVFAVLEPVARALEAARDSGVTCDFLAPADIMIGRAGNDLLSVKLLFLMFNRRYVDGKPEAISTGVSLSKQVVAAPYVALELWVVDAPPVEESGVVYSLGVMAYELASGQKPYDGRTLAEIVQKQVAGQFVPLSKLAPQMPAPVARVVERALAKEEKDRPATVKEFVAELQDALGMKKTTTVTFAQVLADLRIAEADADLFENLAALPPHPNPTISAPKSSSSAEVSITDKPLYMDENMQFTVYQPEAVAPARWRTLLAFAHLSKRRPDAPPDEPEPLAEVKRIAERVLADEMKDYDAVKQNSLHAVPHKGEITFVPDVAGCEFNPTRQSFLWQKSVHKVEFEMRAAASLDGQMARGRLTVFLGSLILADVPLAIRVDSAAALARDRSAREAPTVPVSAAPYRKIFPSYSHKDRAIVEQIEHHVSALGDKYLRDVTELRAGQDWQRWMRDAIKEADMFQLFWSHNSMHSDYVRQEWEYALSLNRPNFVRPTYWEVPLPESPEENLPPAELRQLHFQHLRANYDTDRTTLKEMGYPQPTTQRGLPTEHGGRGGASAYIPSDEAIVCSSCGGRFAQGAVFCGRCGAKLISTAQSSVQPSVQQGPAQPSHQPATASPEEVKDALNVFWEKRKREAGKIASPSPLRPYPQSQPSRGISGRTLLWLGLLLLLLALLLGVYLLVRLL